MKILCLQLARFGDIFMTWPVLRALKRQYPEAEIHGLFRERFAEAAELSNSIDFLHRLPSEKIFRSLIVDNSVEKSLSEIEAFTGALQAKNFDLIINFSFSPLSSYLVESIRGPETKVKGYQRHSDGYLNLADDLSRYFYAQVGPGKANRIHVTELMSILAEAPLLPEDSQFKASTNQTSTISKMGISSNDFIVFHLGASESHKCWSNDFWQLLILQFKTFCPEFHIVLVGSQQELLLADSIEKSLHGERIHNLVGKTSWADLKEIFAAARLFVGADSGPMHLATLMQTAVLNISLGRVNFWETGPRSNLGHILRFERETDANLNEILQVARLILTGKPVESGYRGSWFTPCFSNLRPVPDRESDFNWNLVQSIYLGAAFPPTDKISFVRGMQDLGELNRLALSAIERFTESKIDFLGPYLDRIYESMNAISRTDSSIDIFTSWLRAEKCKIPPMDPSQICQRYYEIHLQFRNLLNPYILPSDLKEDSSYG